MKSIIAIILFFLTSTVYLQAQINDTVPQTVEYAQVKVIIFYKSGNFVKGSKLYPNPILTINDKTVHLININNQEFKTIPEILNFMNRWGWVLISSNVGTYLGSGAQTDESGLLNTNEYFHILLFQRPFKQ